MNREHYEHLLKVIKEEQLLLTIMPTLNEVERDRAGFRLYELTRQKHSYSYHEIEIVTRLLSRNQNIEDLHNLLLEQNEIENKKKRIKKQLEDCEDKPQSKDDDSFLECILIFLMTGMIVTADPLAIFVIQLIQSMQNNKSVLKQQL